MNIVKKALKTTLVASLALATPAIALAKGTITAKWNTTTKRVDVTGTGFTPDFEVELLAEQNAVDSGDLPFYYDFQDDKNGNFSGKQCHLGPVTSCALAVYVTAACRIGFSSLDVCTTTPGGNATVTIPKADCPGAKITGTVNGRTLTVTGTGYTPSGDIFFDAFKDNTDGADLYHADPVASGTLKLGAYNGGKFTVTFTVPTTACGHNVAITAVDNLTDVVPPTLVLRPGC